MDTKHTMRIVDKIFTLFNLSMVINFLYVLLFVGIDSFMQTMNLMILGVVFTLVPAIIWAMYKKIPLIYFYSIATLPVIIMALPSEFIFFGWIEFSYISRYGVMFASMYEAVAYSILVSYYINKIQAENNLQKVILSQKEKQASLGELLIYITHQWRAPLATLSSLVTLNEAKLKKGIDIPMEKVKENILQSKKSIKFMNDTMNNFTSFYMPNKEKSEFSILAAMETVQSIIEKDLLSNHIELVISGDEKIKYFGVSNDISQIILSLISNSKAIFFLRQTIDPYINISFYENTRNLIIEIQDNAGGVKISPIEKIFEPYVSEKEDAGNGVGLYLVKNILESYSGSIQVANENNGAVFTIILPKDNS